MFAIWFFLWLLISFFVLYPFIRFGLSDPKYYRFAHYIRRVQAAFLLFISAIRVKVHSEELLDPKQAYIITPNHTSQFDIVTLTIRLPVFFNFMAKAELERIPLFGIWFRTLDISVERKDPRKAAQAYRKALNWLDQGHSTLIFPEGTIPDQAPQMLRFKEGPFKMAIEKQIPVVPVTIVGNWLVMPDKGVIEGRPGTVHHFIHKPIPTLGMKVKDAHELKEAVYRTISDQLLKCGFPQH